VALDPRLPTLSAILFALLNAFAISPVISRAETLSESET
jgi:hypothetical protein